MMVGTRAFTSVGWSTEAQLMVIFLLEISSGVV